MWKIIWEEKARERTKAGGPPEMGRVASGAHAPELGESGHESSLVKVSPGYKNTSFKRTVHFHREAGQLLRGPRMQGRRGKEGSHLRASFFQDSGGRLACCQEGRLVRQYLEEKAEGLERLPIGGGVERQVQ